MQDYELNCQIKITLPKDADAQSLADHFINHLVRCAAAGYIDFTDVHNIELINYDLGKKD